MLHGVRREEGAADRRRSESAIPQEYVPYSCIKLGHYLTCSTNYAVAEAESVEELLRMVLELSDNVPDKADLLDNSRLSFLRSFLYTNKKEDIDNCILAYGSAIHLTPQSHSDMSGRLKIIGESFFHRFQLAGDLTDISKAILYQQKALHLFPEGHEDTLDCLNNLGISFLCRFIQTKDLTDISNAISYQQRAVHLTPEGHANMPGLLEVHFSVVFNTQEILPTFLMPYHISGEQFISLPRAMQTCPPS